MRPESEEPEFKAEPESIVTSVHTSWTEIERAQEAEHAALIRLTEALDPTLEASGFRFMALEELKLLMESDPTWRSGKADTYFHDFKEISVERNYSGTESPIVRILQMIRRYRVGPRRRNDWTLPEFVRYFTATPEGTAALDDTLPI